MRPNLIVDPFFFAQAEYLIIASGGYCSYVNADVVITYVIEGKFFKSRDYVYANMVPQVEMPAAWYMALVFFLCNLPQVIVCASKVVGLALYGTNLGDARHFVYEMDDDDEESTLAAMLLQFPHTVDVLTVPASEAPAAAMPEADHLRWLRRPRQLRRQRRLGPRRLSPSLQLRWLPRLSQPKLRPHRQLLQAPRP